MLNDRMYQAHPIASIARILGILFAPVGALRMAFLMFVSLLDIHWSVKTPEVLASAAIATQDTPAVQRPEPSGSPIDIGDNLPAPAFSSSRGNDCQEKKSAGTEVKRTGGLFK